MIFDKRILNFLVIVVWSFLTFWWMGFIFHIPFDFWAFSIIVVARMSASFLIMRDYSLSWSKATQKTFLLKAIVYSTAFVAYVPILYTHVRLAFLVSELFLYLFSINFLMYSYYYFINKSRSKKNKSVVIFGAGAAGVKLKSEYRNSKYKLRFFIDDDEKMQRRSINGIRILSRKEAAKELADIKPDLFVIAIPSASSIAIKEIYDEFAACCKTLKVLPKLDNILQNEAFASQLKSVSVEDLLARHPKDLDKTAISQLIQNATVLITGAGGSIGGEICRQCAKFGAKKLILLDHSEYNLYQIAEELTGKIELALVMQSVVNKDALGRTFAQHKPDIVLHAAAYKHVPLVEDNITEGIINNVIGTKNTIDCAIKHGVKKFVLISTDKAVRPTNVMGTTKRICELYAQNVESQSTEIVSVRFGNVLGSSGSVIPKFKAQIEAGGPITVTHPDITRYFMLIPEACELVLQAGSIGKGGEIFILDMGEPVKIVDLAQKMIELSGAENIDIKFSGLRPGEKLYEELLINDTDAKTQYDSITVAKRTEYNIAELNQDIFELISCDDKLAKLREIVPEFEHKLN